MLLRQALEQTRAGMPTPILFNSHRIGIESAAERAAMEQAFDLHLHTAHNGSSGRSLHRGSAGIGILSLSPRRQAAMAVTGAHAS